MQYRTRTVSLVLTAAEYAEVQRFARRERQTMSPALRGVVLPVIRRRLKKHRDLKQPA